MNVATYIRHRLVRAGADASKVDSASFAELCVFANDEFGEEALRNWGVWHVVDPYLKAAA